MDEALRDELLRRSASDQEQRERIMELGVQPRKRLSAEAREAIQRVRAIDADNTEWLRGVVREHGWPARSLVGEEGVHPADARAVRPLSRGLRYPTNSSAP